METREAVSAANRFGLGARPDELAGIDDPRGWLKAQLRGDADAAVFADLPSSLDYLQREDAFQRERRQARQAGDTDPKRAQSLAAQLYDETRAQELRRRYQVAVVSRASFAERLVRFWSNHFAISIDKRSAALYAAPMEREAIRPHLFGHFSELLLAVETHPAMLRYLDNVRSVGSDSMQAQRARKRAPQRVPGLNENLAREIMELHTLGVDGGYTQADVTELARAITGWSVPQEQDFARGTANAAFLFRANAHASGVRTLLGRRYAEAGQAQGAAILADLARHPATARHVSYKLARHVVSDRPPPALVEAMARVWRESDGDLASVYRTLIDHPQAWSKTAAKFKTPDDFLVSALRAGGSLPQQRPRALFELLNRMGQPPFTPRSPAGFADDADEWSGADALWKRVQAAQALAESLPETRVDPLATAQDVFAGHLDADTLSALRRAESPRDGLALLFASPAFQWRT